MLELQIFLANIYAGLLKFYHSGFFLTVKIILGIYSAVLFVDIILLLVQRGVSGNLRETLTGMDVPVALTRKKTKTRKRWEEIKQKLAIGNPNDYKIAVIEADDFIGEIIAGMGYAGSNFGERLEDVPEGQIANIEGMKEAHSVRNRIIHDDRFVLSREDAEGVLAQYEEFLKSFQVID